tara:strand:+ start:2321 stop:2623 length:303 start_codon:yes stop_codon:yes gene_type:complete
MESRKNNRSKKDPRLTGPDKRDVEESNIRFPITDVKNTCIKIDGKIYTSVGDYTASNTYDSDTTGSDTTGLGLGYYAHKRDERFNYTERKEYGKRKRKGD